MREETLPSSYDGPATWTGAEMRRRDDWRRRFSDKEVAELEAALAETRRRELAIGEIGRDDFPLPTLGPVLKDLRETILRGRGFVLLTGLPIARYDRDGVARLFWGIGAHLGKAVSQNAAGHLLGHVRDLGLATSDPRVRTYQTTERQYYHADSCDIVGLMCLVPAKSGGLSSIISSQALYNAVMARRPELARLLSAPLAVDWRGEVPAGERPFYMMPVFNHHDGLLSTYYVRRYMDSAMRHPEAPRLTPAHAEAFDLIDALADDPAFNLQMAFRPGDMQFLHNPTILHDRTAFEDWPEPERKRHLLRLWLCPPDGRPLPEAYVERWGSIGVGERGGITTPETRPTVPLEPV